jgi:two-component system NarL family response regulator
MTINVLIADDHKMFRQALRVPLEAEPDLAVVGEVGTGEETLKAVKQLAPDVVILDIALPDKNGIQVAAEMSRFKAPPRVVALSGYSERLFLDEMLKAGAQAYVLKSSGAEELIAAIRAVVAGNSFLSPELTHSLIRAREQASRSGSVPLSVLGRREVEVLKQIARGLRSAQIATELGIAVGTVEVHRRNIREKLGLKTTAELTRYAVHHGLTST